MSERRLVNNRYEVERSVGRGGMAEVFLARDILLDRPVVLKVLFPEFATDPSFVERFRREAQSAANLSHPNIVAVYDWGTLNNTYFIAMEYVPGKTLADLLKEKGSLGTSHVSDIAIEVASALGFAHENGVVHRDIKPGNILISNTGQVKVADFGIARALGAAVEDGLTQSGAVMGTATYLSPEQAQGAQPDPRSDLYSLGVTMYEMVAGRAPFVGDSPVAVTYQHVHAMPTPLREIREDVSIDFEAIVAKCMAKSPKRRYESASALRDDIRRSINREPVRALDAVLPRMETAPTTAIPVLTAESLPPLEDEFDEAIPGRTAAYIFGAVFLALLLLGTGIFVFRALSNTATDNISVPNVVNLPLAEASRILLDLGLTPIPNAVPTDGVDDDIVYQQDPPATALAREGDVVTITYNPASQRATVPPIQGLLVKDATALLAPLGLQLTISEVRNDPTIPINQIISQDPIAGTEVRAGSAVRVVVSGGTGDLVVPNVEGQLASAATQLLTTAPYNFVVTTVDEVNETVEVGRVLRTEPTIGSPIGNGAPITLVVSKGSNKVVVPQVEGLTEGEAQSALSIAGLTWDIRYQNVPENDPNVGRVISQSPRAGERVAPASKVSLVVGQVVVP